MYYDKIALTTASGETVTLHAYVPYNCKNNPSQLHAAVVICPGGGYAYTSDREAEPIALRFLTMNFCAFWIDYRVAPNRFPCALQDTAMAVAWVRQHAAELFVDPDKIAVMGFSAGGHVAASLGVMWQNEALFSPLGLTSDAVRPNALVLCYPVITAGEYAHRGSFICLTGSEDVQEHAPYSLETLVTEQTPPTFLWHTWEDGAVPVENTLFFAAALRKAGCTAEVHIFPKGHHGLSLANSITAEPDKLDDQPAEIRQWPELAGRFLQQMM